MMLLLLLLLLLNGIMLHRSSSCPLLHCPLLQFVRDWRQERRVDLRGILVTDAG